MSEFWFWIISALLLVVAALFVALPLWRGAARNNSVVRDAANLEILRDQAAEMDADLANGLLTPELHAQGRRELEARLLEEVQSTTAPEAGQRHPLKILAIVLALLIPAASFGLYWKLGNQDALNPILSEGGMLTGERLQELEARLERNPRNPEGWLLLARSYYELEQYKGAARAYDHLTQLVPNEAELWTDYADSLAMSQGQSLLGKPTELLEKALALNPDHFKALALSGSAAMERGDYAVAVRDWEKLYNLLPDKETEDAKAIASGLEQARDFLARSGGAKQRRMAPRAASSGKERITGTVMLSDALKSQAKPDETVFILARAMDGPPMPLAAIKIRVRDLPFRFALDDTMAIMPQAKISGFDKVVVVARVSRSGTAMPKAGDLQGNSAPVKPGAQGVKVTISNVVK